jgi:hypothetical protein
MARTGKAIGTARYGGVPAALALPMPAGAGCLPMSGLPV